MASRKSPQALGDVMGALIQRMGIQTKIDEARVIETWAIMVGPSVNGVTDKVWINKGRLYVKITSAAWRQELHLRRRAWCERLNQTLGEDLVREIYFR